MTGEPRRNRNCLHEIATAPSGPRNDKSGNLHGRRNCFKICNCQWRSGSAATDAIGLCVFSVARANCKCLHEIATAPSGPRNDKSGNLHGRRNCFKICNCQWRSGSAATDAIGLCVFSVARANCKCLHEIATAPSGPRNDKSGNLHGRRNCFKICNCQWRSGSAATDAIGLCVFSVARANCKCLPEIATAPSGPRNDKSGECGGDQSTSAVEYLCTRRSLPVKGTPHP